MEVDQILEILSHSTYHLKQTSFIVDPETGSVAISTGAGAFKLQAHELVERMKEEEEEDEEAVVP